MIPSHSLPVDSLLPFSILAREMVWSEEGPIEIKWTSRSQYSRALILEDYFVRQDLLSYVRFEQVKVPPVLYREHSSMGRRN